MKIAIKDMFFKQILNILKNYLIYTVIYHIYQKEEKLINTINSYAICMTKKLCFSLKSFKRSIKSWINSKKVHRITQFNEIAWLKSHIDMDNKFREEAKTDFEIDFFKLMINLVFGKTIENARRYRDIKLVRTDKKEVNQYQKLITQQNSFRRVCQQQQK